MAAPFDQVSAVVARVQRELVLARFLGKIAVDQGLAEVRSRLEAVVFPTPADEAPVRTDAERSGTEDPGNASARTTGDVRTSSATNEVDTGELALADYDSLPASDIVAKLAGLEPDELDAIERYELAHRQRRTVLGRIRQLQAP